MRGARFFGLSLLMLAACGSSGSTTNPIDGGADASAAFAYTPAGCAYTFTPPDSDAFTDLANDGTDVETDVTSSAPVRLRIGVAGGTTSGKPGYAAITPTPAFTCEETGISH